MIEITITSSVLILVVVALRFVFSSKISRRLRYAIWGIVLLRLLIPLQITQSLVSVLNIVPYDAPAQIRHGLSDRAMVGGAVEFDYRDIGESDNAAQQENSVSPAPSVFSVNYFVNQTPLIVIWLMGAIVTALWYTAVNLIFYRRLRRRRRSLDVENCRLPVYIVDDLQSPCLYGVFRPAIYMTPKALESERAAAHILAHELIHFAHKDHLWSFLRGVCIAVYWFNPFVWLAAILSRTDCELACDEAAVLGFGEENRIDYGRTLVDMIARKRAPDTLFCAATTMASGTSGIKKRLNMIVQNKKTVIPALIVVFLVVVIATGATFTGALTTEDSPNESSGNLPDTPVNAQIPCSLPPGFDIPTEDGGAPIYQVNERGQTYGSAQWATTLETLPDLMRVGYANHTEIYVYSAELLNALPKTPEEAQSYVNNAHTLPVYESDGRTVVEWVSWTADFSQLPESVIELFSIPVYPVNENGQTFGPENPYLYLGQTPDLIAAIGIDGTQGYIYNSLQNQHGGYSPPQSPDEAIEYMEWLSGRQDEMRRNGEIYALIVPLYAEDGVTVIGEFGYGGESASMTEYASPDPPSGQSSPFSGSLQITYLGQKVMDVTIPAGVSFPLNVMIEPKSLDFDGEITWTSSDTSVFEVVKDNPEGTTATVTIIGSGSGNYAVLTVAMGDVQAECIIRVYT